VIAEHVDGGLADLGHLARVARDRSLHHSHGDLMKTVEHANAAPREVSSGKKLDQLYSLIDGIETTMMTTRTVEGALVSRPMQVQAREAGTDLWFMTTRGNELTQQLAVDPILNLTFVKSGATEWVSVSGRARVTTDFDRIRQFYKPSWKLWLPDEGGERDGGPHDPRIALIEVEATGASFMKSNQPGVVKLFEMAKAMVTGTMPDLGDVGTLSGATLAQGEARDDKGSPRSKRSESAPSPPNPGEL
jgi:general stress protein 26